MCARVRAVVTVGVPRLYNVKTIPHHISGHGSARDNFQPTGSARLFGFPLLICTPAALHRVWPLLPPCNPKIKYKRGLAMHAPAPRPAAAPMHRPPRTGRRVGRWRQSRKRKTSRGPLSIVS